MKRVLRLLFVSALLFACLERGSCNYGDEEEIVEWPEDVAGDGYDEPYTSFPEPEDLDFNRIEDLLAHGDAGDVDELKDVIYKLVLKANAADTAPPPPAAAPSLSQQQAEHSSLSSTASAPAPAPAPASCSSFLSCQTCIDSGHCAWCIGARACKEDIPWQCQGDTDHISYSGIGLHTACPTPEELAERRREREGRKQRAAAAGALGAPAEGVTSAAAAAGAAAASAASSPAQTQEAGEDDEPVADSEQRYGAETKSQHLAALRERAQLAESVTSGPAYGALHPYETLGLTPAASGGEVRKAYRRLSLLFHPDKHTGAGSGTGTGSGSGSGESLQALATLAFKDIVAAFEILGSAEKRAFFDDMGAAGEPMEAFNTEAAYARWGRKNEQNFYQGHALITPLTEANWEARVGRGNQLWIVQFYAPWCGHCQQSIPSVKRLADLLKDDEDVEVGAVNCVTEARICGEWMGIRQYPTFLAVNDQHGTRQEYQDGSFEPEAIAEWTRKIAREWRYLLSQGRLHSLTTVADFERVVVNSTDFVVVAFMDGFDCASCKTAKTNAMRLSASLRGYEGVSVAVVNCDSESMSEFCSTQQLPLPPFAPIVKGYPSGNKTAAAAADALVGRVLYNSNEVEPHIALQMIEAIVRLLLADKLTAANAVRLAGAEGEEEEGGYAADKKKEEAKPPPEPEPEMHWNGPQRRVAVEWGGDSEGPILTSPRLGF